jgi:hypothetical protein
MLYRATFILGAGELNVICTLKEANEFVKSIYDIKLTKRHNSLEYFKSRDGTEGFIDANAVVGAYVSEDDSEQIKRLQELEAKSLENFNKMSKGDNDEPWKSNEFDDDDD